MLPRTLNDLPVELLLAVSEHLEPVSLLYLSMLNRRLQFVLLPSFFAAYGYELPTNDKAEIRLSKANMDVLHGLRISLCTTSLESLSCRLNSGTEALFRELHLLHCLVERLDYLGQLNINLVDVNFRDCPHESRPAILQNWAHKLTALLNVVVSRGDTALTVVYGTKSLTARRHLHRSSPLSRPSSRDKSPKRLNDVTKNSVVHPILRNIGNCLRSLSPSHSKSPKRSRQSPERKPQIVIQYSDISLPYSDNVAIENLGIHSVVLLRPPFLQWTINTLNTAKNLSTLSFDNVSLSSNPNGFSCIPESDFLKSLTLISLSKIVFGNCDIEWNDLIEFLNRHPSLVELDLYRNTFRPSSNPIQPIPSLRKLKSIIATPEYLIQFLSLPNLEKITITSDYHGMPPYGYDYRRFLRVFSLLDDNVIIPPRSIHLELRFLCGIGLEPWLSSVSSFGIGPINHVRSLELGTDNRFVFTKEIIQALVPFIGCLFPSVRGITFRAKCVFGDGRFSCEEEMVEGLRRVCVDLGNVDVTGSSDVEVR